MTTRLRIGEILAALRNGELTLVSRAPVSFSTAATFRRALTTL